MGFDTRVCSSHVEGFRYTGTLEVNGNARVSDKDDELHVFDIKISDFLLSVSVLLNIFFLLILNFFFSVIMQRLVIFFHNNYVSNMSSFVFVQINHLWWCLMLSNIGI